jgi:glycosyltransferase involved in cell wall biosynthesis
VSTLLVLVHNEEKFIEKVIKKYIQLFEQVIVVDDFSNDNSLQTVENLGYEKVHIIKNRKNLGAGKSLQAGINKFLQTESEYLIKIDGDNQFDFNDVSKLLNIAKSDENYDFVKCDRFWDGGIEGEIPSIRYYGNAFASFLIKFSTGNWSINDPLNGLFLFSKNAAKKIQIPKLFFRYGYPFYLCSLFSNHSIISGLKFAQTKNKVSYGEENSSLKALTLFIKLLRYTITNYFRNIGKKVKVSSLHLSALLDVLSILIIPLLIYSLYKIIYFRYFNSIGSHYNWFTLLMFLFILFLISVISSQKIANKISKKNFYNL